MGSNPIEDTVVRKYRNYTDEDIMIAVVESRSLAEVCRRLDLVPIGGNYKTIKKHITRLDLDVSHHIGQAWSRGASLVLTSQSNSTLKKIVANERGYKCQECSINSWNGLHLVLELDHIDGNNSNNKMENLRLLCPNCHSQTVTFRNRKR